MLNGRLQQGGPGQPGMAVGQPGLPPGASPAPPTASSSPGVMAPPGAAVVAGPGAPTGIFHHWFMDSGFFCAESIQVLAKKMQGKAVLAF